MFRNELLLLLCLLALSSRSGLAENTEAGQSEESCNRDEPVAELDPYGLEKFVAENQVVLVNFCIRSGKCRLLDSEFTKAATQCDSGARFARVDGEAHRSIGPIYGVQDFPTIRIFIDGRMIDDYSGRRVAADIRAAADKLMSQKGKSAADKQDSAVKRLTATSFVSVTHDMGLNAFIMFEGSSSCDGFSQDLNAVARTFADISNITVAVINAAEYPEATEPYTRHGLPAFVFFPQADPFFGFKPQPVVYADMRTAVEMVRFINRKCRLKQPLLSPQAGAGSSKEDSLPGVDDRDAPAWIFQPATPL